ncbi:MAG: response regulator, partial [Lachnospiraceae bacterium]|nr:response regulator [Lachnospiraceae bacterium]
GEVLSYGLILLLFVAGSKTAREMLDIEREKQSAIAAGAAKTRFLANMSHEIRTPINTIIGMNEMILRENNDSAIEEYAQSVQSASKLLLGLVNDVLDFSKIEAGKLEIIETEYNLSKLLHDVVEGIKARAQSKNLKLEVLIENPLPAVLKGDEIRIRQILNNLLSNAVKYTKEGTVTLKVKGIREEERFLLHMSVKDTGMGIKEEDLKKLFSRFQRLEEEKNRYIEGTGLGLNITRQLAELMDGNIEVSSVYGEGSCFTLIIPQEIVRQEEIKENRKGLYAPTAEILVVDDNQMNLMVIGALLKRTAVKLTKAHGGLECLDLCKKNKYDLILMDHMMPDPDGIETLHLLRKDKESLNRNTEVIVLTANAIAGMSDMYIAEGFNDYLSKPVVAEDLEEMLGKHLPAEKIEFN